MGLRNSACFFMCAKAVALSFKNSAWRSWFILSKLMVWADISFFMYAIFASLHAKHATPLPGKVILDVEANSNTISGLPASLHSVRISLKGWNSPSNS